jgi:RHS repeat-associated protein
MVLGIALGAGALMALGTAFGQPGGCGPSAAGATCGGAGVASQGNTSGTPQGAGNPINLITGNKVITEVDLPPLPGVLGLEIVRHYNSVLSGPQTPTTVIGRGWRLSYDTELAVTGSTVQVLQADGTRLSFQRDPANPSLCASADPAQGELRGRRGADGESFDWHWTNGRVLSFDSRGKLVQIKAASGEFVTLQRDGRGHLVKVTDPQGRSLVLHYPRAGETSGFRGVAHIDSPVGRYSFRYGRPVSEGSEPAPVDRLANLVAVIRPDVDGHTVERRYHHEDARFPTLVTGISVRGRDGFGGLLDQRIATYAYAEDGRGRLSQLGHGADALETVTVDRTRPGETRLTNSRGQVTVYRHALVAGQWRLLESRGPGCASCGPTNLRFGYDSAGRVVRETALDDSGRPIRTRETDRDALGRVVEVRVVDHRAGVAPGARWVERYHYDGAGFEPVAASRPSVVPGAEARTRWERNAAGQVTAAIEAGFSPIDGNGRAMRVGPDGRVSEGQAGQAQLVERRTEWGYASVNGRSVLTRIDGPLANGPSNSPLDSDVTLITWDAQGRYIERIDRPGRRTSWVAHDAAGRVVGVRDADGQTTSLQHDARGEVLSVLQQAGASGPVSGSLSVFDALSQRVEHRHGWMKDGALMTVADAANWRAGHDIAGRPRWHVNALGHVERWEHDTEGLLTRRSSQSSRIERFVAIDHDPHGRPLRVSDANGVVWQRGDHGASAEADDDRLQALAGPREPSLRLLHDDFGRTVARLSVDHGDTVYEFDASDRLIASTDALGQRGEYEWDLRGRIVRQALRGTDGQTVETRWTYEGRHLVAIDHPQQREWFRHDPAGRLVEHRISVDAAVRAGGTEVVAVRGWQYDDAGRVIAQSLPDGSVLRWQRNGQGQVTGVVREQMATTWLQALVPAERLATGIERDLNGPSRLEFGNGFEARWLRSADGHLARVLHRAVDAGGPLRQAGPAWPLDLPGLRSAHASIAAAPGWLGRPAEPDALVDDRFAWDRAGNLIRHEQRGGGVQRDWAYLYDDRDQLLQASARDPAGHLPSSISRWAYDARGNRVGAQGAAAGAGLQRVVIEPGSHRLAALRDPGSESAQPYRHDSTGLPARHGPWALKWDATGRLAEASADDGRQARYAYNHRGERVLRWIDDHPTVYLNDKRRRQAEVDHRGLITRQWVYLADLPLAVIDHPDGAAPMASQSAAARLLRDLRVLARMAFSSRDRTAFLHTNHLGAPVAATDRGGDVLWQADYDPFGRAVVRANPGFSLDLRLPGQHEDAETGLHHNDHRLYDPTLGRYLTPDPLGAPDGPNPYIYVRNNPMKHVDPSGLILFSFDGTRNTPASRTNVWHFAQSYDDFSDYDRAQGYTGLSFYMPGVGTGMDDGPADSALALSLNRRIDTQYQRFRAYVQSNWDWHVGRAAGASLGRLTINLDVAGFSRGAASAREFSNRVSDFKRSREYLDWTCLQIIQRLMALFDTVLSESWSSGPRPRMAIPDDVQMVFHAVAANERRWMFDLESIAPSAATVAQHRYPEVRIERAFVGAHSDIGGGYSGAEQGATGGDLSDLALLWMVQMASRQGVRMRPLEPEQRTVTSPIVHDERRSSEFRPLTRPWMTVQNREVNFTEPAPSRVGLTPDELAQAPSGRQRQVLQARVQWAAGMSQQTAEEWVEWHDPETLATNDVRAGRVGHDQFCDYLDWLRVHYVMAIDDHAGCSNTSPPQARP